MSNYVRGSSTFFGDKDSLPTGDSAKIVVGSQFDDEFNDIATMSTTKIDTTSKGAVNGVAPLDGTGLILASDLPDATETSVGALEIATSAESAARAATNKIVVPSVFDVAADAWAGLQAGMAFDLQQLADPGVDKLFFWDDSASALKGLDGDASLAIVGTTIGVVNSGVDHDQLANFVAGEHILHSGVTLTAGTGLTGGGTIAASRSFNLDISALTALSGTNVAATDGYLVDDGGTMKRIAHQSAGVPIATVTGTTDTLVDGDVNSYIRYTNAAAVTVTINTGVGEKGNVIIMEAAGGTNGISFAGTATITSSGTADEIAGAQYAVGILVCHATNNWTLYGAVV